MPEYISQTAYMFKAILAALALTLACGWIGIKLARRYNLMDNPGKDPRKQHQFPTPLAGGIALMMALTILATAFNLWQNPQIGALLLSSGIIFVFGLWDDAKKLSPLVKFSGQMLAILILAFFDIRIQILEAGSPLFNLPSPFYLWLDRLLTVLWIIGVTNAFNLVDSMDGLSVGLAAWACGFFMLAALDSQQNTLSLLSAIVLGICLGLNYYNASPARLFLGDAGALLLGYIASVIAILYSPSATYQASSWFVPILLVGVPIFDTTLVFFSRLRRGLPFYKGGRDHTYHRLVSFGLEPGRAVLTMHMAAIILECAAFIATTLEPLRANLIFAACLLAGGISMMILEKSRGLTPLSSPLPQTKDQSMGYDSDKKP